MLGLTKSYNTVLRPFTLADLILSGRLSNIFTMVVWSNLAMAHLILQISCSLFLAPSFPHTPSSSEGPKNLLWDEFEVHWVGSGLFWLLDAFCKQLKKIATTLLKLENMLFCGIYDISRYIQATAI